MRYKIIIKNRNIHFWCKRKMYSDESAETNKIAPLKTNIKRGHFENVVLDATLTSCPYLFPDTQLYASLTI